MDNSIGIVILNFKVYEETKRCVSSIRSVTEQRYPIVIVDNGSGNGSYQHLKEYYKAWSGIDVIENHKNKGFAKGNNYGIHYLKSKYHTKFIFLLNSDTLIEDKYYFEKLLRKYKKGVGVIEANIRNGRGDFVQPIWESVSVWANGYRFLQAFCKYYDIYWPFKELPVHKKYLCQIGCAIMLTPDYFDIYEGLYSHTFLYGEEQILLILLERMGLELEFANDTYLVHKEGRSTGNAMLAYSRKKEKKALKGYWNIFLASCMPTRALIEATKWRKN